MSDSASGGLSTEQPAALAHSVRGVSAARGLSFDAEFSGSATAAEGAPRSGARATLAGRRRRLLGSNSHVTTVTRHGADPWSCRKGEYPTEAASARSVSLHEAARYRERKGYAVITSLTTPITMDASTRALPTKNRTANVRRQGTRA